MKMVIQTDMTMIIKKIKLMIILLLAVNCTNKKSFNRNIEDEKSFKNELLNSMEESVSADKLFKGDDVFYIFPPYYPLVNIKEEIDGFSETFYYEERVNSDYIDVAEGVYLIISMEKGNIKKCLPIKREQFSFARLKSNRFEVKKTDFILREVNDKAVQVELTQQ